MLVVKLAEETCTGTAEDGPRGEIGPALAPPFALCDTALPETAAPLAIPLESPPAILPDPLESRFRGDVGLSDGFTTRSRSADGPLRGPRLGIVSTEIVGWGWGCGCGRGKRSFKAGEECRRILGLDRNEEAFDVVVDADVSSKGTLLPAA
jgi:hypothetical protein